MMSLPMPLSLVQWSFQPSPLALSLAVAALLAMAFFSFRAWQRAGAGARLRMGALEGLRLLIGALIVLTLLRPERVVTTPSEFEPEVAVLLDHSGSMNTVDVPAGAGIVSRAKWLADLQAGTAFDQVKQAYKTTFIPFNSKEEGGRKAADGTDLSLALGEQLAGIRNLRAVLLVSDGDWNTGPAPVGAAAKLRQRGVPVYAALAGFPTHLPDVELKAAKFPAFCLAREKVAIPFEVANHLPHEVRTTVTISCNGKVEGEKEITIPAGGEAGSTLIWLPPAVGRHTLTLAVPVQADEVDPANNARTFDVEVRQEKLRVLVVESVPRWEYRYLRNALSRDPDVEVETLLLHPGIGPGSGKGYLKQFPSKEALATFDVVFIGDIGVGAGEITTEQAAGIRGLVEKQGGGVVFLPGIRGRQATWVGSPLDDMLPVELEAKPDPKLAKGVISLAETRFQLTTLGSRHLLTMLADSPAGNDLVWRSLPGFTWNAAVKKLRSGSDLLAVNPLVSCDSGRMPVLAIRPFGTGQALFMGIDSAWRWRKGVEDLYHYRFWGQVVRWMAHKRHLAGDQGVRLFYTPETPMAGAAVRFNALLHDRAGFPCQKETVQAQLIDPDGKVAETFLLAESSGEFGSYEGQVTPVKSGRHTLKLTASPSGLSLDAAVEVGAETREVVGRPARPAPLEEIARLTKGAYAAGADLPALAAQIKALPKAADIEVRQALWCQWWWGAILLGLLALYWSIRKALGLI